MGRSILMPSTAIPEPVVPKRREETPREKADAAVRDFVGKHEELRAFFADNEDLMSEFLNIVFEYNAAHTLAKGCLAKASEGEPFQSGPFSVSRPSTKVVWDPTKLPDDVLTRPGVVKALDSRVLDTLKDQGLISAAVARKARSVTTGTAAVSGPKPVVIEL